MREERKSILNELMEGELVLLNYNKAGFYLFNSKLCYLLVKGNMNCVSTHVKKKVQAIVYLMLICPEI